MSSTSRVAAKQTFLVPAIAASWVLVVGGSLLLIIGRSPYTHGNLLARPDVSYARTAQITVGAVVPLTVMHGRAAQLAQAAQPAQPIQPAPSAATPIPSSFTSTPAAAQSLVADGLMRGQALMVTAGCATCHSLTGRGGPVGPSIVTADAKKLRTKTNTGTGGMPAYAPGALSDDDLSALAAYLASQAKQTATPAVPAVPAGK